MMSSIGGRINTFLLVMLVVMAGAIIAILATRASAGPLDPPGTPASTGRNVIFQPADCSGFPIVISQAGSYVLGGDITGCPGADGIEISTSNVTLDLDGHVLSGGGHNSGSLDGIKNVGGNGQLVIKNGEVQQWGQNGINLKLSSVATVDHIEATYNGVAGIVIQATSAVIDSIGSANGANTPAAGIQAVAEDNRISGCQADYNSGSGILLQGTGDVLEDCEVASNQGNIAGVAVSDVERIVRNHVHNNVGRGISAGASAVIEDNSVEWNGGAGIECSSNCSVTRNTVASNSGIGVSVSGGVGTITDNVVLANVGHGIDVTGPSPGYANVIARNVSTGNDPAHDPSPGNYFIGANNDFGPDNTAAGATSPTTNVDR